MPLVLSAVAVFLLVLARVYVQSMTIDEATMYEVFVAPAGPMHWEPASNNHILNSLIMRLFVGVFGASHLTIRSGALAGALVYISAAVVFCRSISRSELLRWAAFVCLACNPFVLDYLVAARGYSLASGFLLAGLAVVARHKSRDGGSPLAVCGICSVLAALAVAANFSFAFIAAALLTALVICFRRAGVVPVLAAGIVPGFIVSVLLTLHAALTWPAGQLWWGAKTLGETGQSVLDSLLHAPNAHLLSPWTLAATEAVRPWIVPALLAVAALTAALVRRDWRVQYAGVLVASVAAALFTHWIGLTAGGMLLPKERTAIWVPVVLLTAAVLAVAAARHAWVRAAATATLTLAAVYFLGCLRLTYFKEWSWNAGTREAYWVAAYYNHTYGVKRVASSWHHSAVLNVYRAMSGGRDTIESVVSSVPPPAGYQLYVLVAGLHQEFIDRQQLRVVYRGAGDVVVAIDPRVESAQP